MTIDETITDATIALEFDRERNDHVAATSALGRER
jgi:hypothetical protein